MIIDISNECFKRIFDDKTFHLPIRWNGIDFISTLEYLFNQYINRLELFLDKAKYDPSKADECINIIKYVTGLLKKAVKHYLDGFPSRSYIEFACVMDVLTKTPLKIYQNDAMGKFENENNRNLYDVLNLFRVTCVYDNRPYTRERVFHTPYNLRSKVSTSRYSIAGYPSLYLGTSLSLCCEEIHTDPYMDNTLASLFKLERTSGYTNTHIQIIELGIKPQDFLYEENNNENNQRQRYIDKNLLKKNDVKYAYLMWYPLIAACSYIRTNKKDPFAAEYIIPQLLMQWVRSEIDSEKYDDYDQLIGIRYFSCASVRASDMGFNYVFPTSGQQKSADVPYCSVLADAFRLTAPVYIHEYDSISECELYLSRVHDYDFIGSK